MNLDTAYQFVPKLNCIFSSILKKLHYRFLPLLLSETFCLKKLLFLVFFFCFVANFAFPRLQESLHFDWNTSSAVFMHKEEENPTLHLFEHCHYRIDSLGAEFSITELNDSLYSGNDLFKNSIKGAGEYILFSPDENTPRALVYQNLSLPGNKGEIKIKSYDEKALLKMGISQQGTRFGANIALSSDAAIFASAPGFNQNEGLVVQFSVNGEGDYEQDLNISSPTSDPISFGSSLFYDNNATRLLIGSPNNLSFKGSIHDYYPAAGNLATFATGAINGDLFGWSTFSAQGKIFAGSLAVSDSLGGYVSGWNASSATPVSFLEKLRPPTPQFGNEFGHSLYFSNDYLLVGAPGEDDLIREDTGAVYLFRLQDDFSVSTKILPSNRNNNDRFGQVVWLSDELIFVGAPNGDGETSNSGLVYIFSFNPQDLSVQEIFRILPPVATSGIMFGQNFVVHGEFIFISAPRSDDTGVVYIYKRERNSLSWKHVNSIYSDQFSDHLSMPDNINLAVSQGILTIGLEEESSIYNESGAIQVLYNPAWDYYEVTALPPFFENNEMIEVNATEDQPFPVSIDFNASIPETFLNPIHWEVTAYSEEIPTDNFDINFTSGEFTFYLPENLSGLVPFEVSATYGDQNYSHRFGVNINPVQDRPLFLDIIDGELNLLELATVGEIFDVSFSTIDVDGDSLSLSVYGQLPPGLSIDGLSLNGLPTSEGNYTFTLGLSDGLNESNQTFLLQVHTGNLGPVVSFEGQNLSSPASLDLNFIENFSLSEWREKLRDLNIIDQDSEDISIDILQHPSNGYLVVADFFKSFNEELIRYTPKFNFSGNDSFTLRFTDDHIASPKHFDVTFGVSIESQNSSPFITSANPNPSVFEGEYFEHVFEIFDAEEDYYHVSFQNLPGWLSFDGVRRIFGKPDRTDFAGSDDPFFISVTDEWGATYTKKIQIGVVPSNYPPVITYHDQNASLISFNLDEDGPPLEFILSANDPDDEDGRLIWEISNQPLHGEASLETNESRNVTVSYLSDGNFSGYDFLEIVVQEEQDSAASDKIRVEFMVNPVQDAPRFETKPFPGIVYNRPWIYEVRGIDGDINDKLTLSSLVNFPEWLKLTQTGSRTWTFRGQPTQLDAEIPISLRLSDQNNSVDQNFTLKVLENIEDLYFIQNEEVELSLSSEFPLVTVAEIDINEDTNWSIDELAVNSINDIRVQWHVVQSPENGRFSFNSGINGKITNLLYLPNRNFFGTDKIILEAFDNYSSARLEISFHIISIEDPLEFMEYPVGVIEDENEKFDFFISYEDGDGLDTLNDLEFSGLPSWLNVQPYESTEFSNTIRLFGEPSVEDIGASNISAKISDKVGIEKVVNFSLKVTFLNKPPVPSPKALSLSFKEDSYSEMFPKKWINFFSVIDEETSTSELTWSIIENPNHGTARINENGKELSYYPDANYSGEDYFSIGVMDRGANNSLPRQATIPVTIRIEPLNDLPVFQSHPPSDSNNYKSATWNDEKDYFYEVSVLDSDWPWQGYPTLSLRSSLPSWANWNDLGNGRAILRGSPKWFHQGNYSFTIVAKSGADEILQDFDLEIRVDDYPPRVQDSFGSIIYKKIQIFVLEDGNLDDVSTTVQGLSAFNPDKFAGESLRWLLYQNPSSGGEVSFTSYMDDDKNLSRITDFYYRPPPNFNGIDRFTLIVDEGDRQTEVPFEINIKSIPDPPVFLEGGSLSLNVDRGSYFEKKINAIDPDHQSVDFKLLYPTNNSKWLTIKTESNDALAPFVKVGGIVPQDFGQESYTLIASDPTGRFSLLELEISTSP